MMFFEPLSDGLQANTDGLQTICYRNWNFLREVWVVELNLTRREQRRPVDHLEPPDESQRSSEKSGKNSETWNSEEQTVFLCCLVCSYFPFLCFPGLPLMSLWGWGVKSCSAWTLSLLRLLQGSSPPQIRGIFLKKERVPSSFLLHLFLVAYCF